VDSEYRKYTLLSFFIFSSLCAYILYLILTQFADWMRWGGSNVLWGQSWAVVGGGACAIVALGLLIGLATNSKAVNFVDDVFSEAHKVTWPNLETTAKSTVVVSIMIAIAAGVLFAIDWVWGVFFKVIL
jgi:preprotein translocase SecE subunit